MVTKARIKAFERKARGMTAEDLVTETLKKQGETVFRKKGSYGVDVWLKRDGKIYKMEIKEHKLFEPIGEKKRGGRFTLTKEDIREDVDCFAFVVEDDVAGELVTTFIDEKPIYQFMAREGVGGHAKLPIYKMVEFKGYACEMGKDFKIPIKKFKKEIDERIKTWVEEMEKAK